MNPTSASIEVDNLVKTYPGATRPALDGVSLSIEPGEFVTLLGPSGSGKTTTLNIIAGFEVATAGSVRIGGQDVLGVPPHKRNLGIVFQNYALFPHMNVRDNVAFPLRQRKIAAGRIDEEVSRILDVVGLGQLGDRRPSQLSGGQQQRVALARALVFGPPVLLMDEPLGALDKKLREQLQGEIARIHRETGTTVVFVTHDQEEALALSDRIAIYDQGAIVQCGTPHELYETPASTFVAEFLGDSNIFRGEAAKADGRATINLGTGRAILASTPVSSRCEVLVRPENISLREAATSDDSFIAGRVARVTYQGAFRKVHLVDAEGRELTARESIGHATRWSVGDEVAAVWSSSDAVLLNAGAR